MNMETICNYSYNFYGSKERCEFIIDHVTKMVKLISDLGCFMSHVNVSYDIFEMADRFNAQLETMAIKPVESNQWRSDRDPSKTKETFVVTWYASERYSTSDGYSVAWSVYGVFFENLVRAILQITEEYPEAITTPNLFEVLGFAIYMANIFGLPIANIKLASIKDSVSNHKLNIADGANAILEMDMVLKYAERNRETERAIYNIPLEVIQNVLTNHIPESQKEKGE